MLQNLLRTLNSFSKTTVLLICCCCLGCGNGEKEIDDPDRPDRPDGDEYEDIEVVDGKVRFYLSESENGIRRPMGVGERVWNESKVTVNGKPYAIATDENDRRYIDVAASNAGTYNATLTTTESGSWYDTSVYTDVKLPYSQFWTTTAQALQSYPMYGSYTKENGNKLIFDDAFAVLDVALTGSAEIASVKVASPDEEIVAGFANYLPSRGGFSMTEGVDFAVLNCTDDGRCVALDKGTPKHFHIMLAPGDYPTGLEITVGDAEHRAMKHTLASLQLAAGEVYTVDLAYTPDADLVFYEGFDNFVWGGDIMGGQEASGYAPTAETVTTDSGTDRDGYADAFERVAYNNPGSAFIQSNTWDEVNGKTVGTSHQMSDSYVASRNIADYTFMFRCQEYQGYLACGTGNTGRGIFQTAALQAIEGIGSVRVAFDFCYQYGSTDVLLFQVLNGGMIASARCSTGRATTQAAASMASISTTSRCVRSAKRSGARTFCACSTGIFKTACGRIRPTITTTSRLG